VKPQPRTIAITTLDLARAIADAVLRVDLKGRPRPRNSLMDRPTQAVFRVLEHAGCWFMRVSEDRDGAIRPPARALGEIAGVCRWCGCTDATPCDDGGEPCRWVNQAETLCSACAGIDRLLHTTRGRAELLSAFSALSSRITAAAAGRRRERLTPAQAAGFAVAPTQARRRKVRIAK